MNMKSKALAALFFLPVIAACFPAMAQAQGSEQKDKHAHVTRHGVHSSFASPQEAITGLVNAIRSNDHKRMHEVLGPEADRYIQSKDTDVDNEARARFLEAYDEKSRIESKGDALAILHIGNDDWPLPFPLMKRSGRWSFDAKAGEQEWLDRRIGENELSAIQVALAYVDAQREYVLKDRNQDGLLEYAQRIVSNEGLHDGLYWPRAEGEPISPMGQAFATANKSVHQVSKMESKPYHGYYFRILTAQGKSVAGGAMDYMVNGKLIGGFALIGYPAKYRESGIKTFIVNHDGIVYSKDLGPKTASAADAIVSFDPDQSWQKEAQ
jgi:hypothetical protein